jgi:GntR family transcriptional regulator
MTEPMYRRIAEDLRVRIESGAIPQGTKLPTETELRDRYDGAARNTVRDAIKLLASRGLVETRPGRGTFTTRHVDPFVTTLTAVRLQTADDTGLGGDEGEDAFAEAGLQGRTASASAPQVSVQPVLDDVAARLEIPPGTQVVCRRREFLVDGMPLSLRTEYYPFDFVTDGATDLVRAEGLPGGAASYLEQRLGLVQAGYRERILVRPPVKDEAKFLGIPDDGRVAVIMRTRYQAARRPFWVTVTVLSADRVELVINSGAVPGDHTAPVVA